MITFQLVYSIHHTETGGNFMDESTGQIAIRGRQYPVVYCKIYNGIQEMIKNGITVISLNTRILTFFLAKTKNKSIFWFHLYVIKCLLLRVDDINSFPIVFWILSLQQNVTPYIPGARREETEDETWKYSIVDRINDDRHIQTLSRSDNCQSRKPAPMENKIPASMKFINVTEELLSVPLMNIVACTTRDTRFAVLSRDRQTAPDLHKTLYFRRKRDRLTERSDIQHQTNG